VKPINKYLIKQFFLSLLLASSVDYILGVLVFTNSDNSINKALFFGLAFSTVMVFVYLNINNYEAIGLKINELTDEQLKHHQKAEVKTKLSLKQIEDKLQQSIYFNRLKVEVSNEAISFAQKPKGLSWGERINIKKIDARTNRYLVESKPIFGFQLFEYGINLRNLHELKKLLS